MRSIILSAWIAVAITSNALATITEWSGRPKGTDWDIFTGSNVTILANGTFKFESVTSGNLDAIGAITVDNSVTGPVTLIIERSSDNNTPGATNVGRIDLINANATPTTGELAELRITGSLGGSGVSEVTSVTGPVVIAGDLAHTFDAAAGGVTGSIDIGGDIATARQLKVGDMTGDITVGGDIGSGGGGVNGISAGNLVGNIEIGGYLSGNIALASLDGNLLLTQTGGSTHGGSVTIGTAMAPTSYDGEITCLARAGGNWTFHGDVDGDRGVGARGPQVNADAVNQADVCAT